MLRCRLPRRRQGERLHPVKRIASVFNRLEKAGTHAEDALLLIILISMILLAGTQIFLRNFLDTSLFWGDEMLRLMVLWLTIAGGLAASRMDKHISIAVLDRFLPRRPNSSQRSSLICLPHSSVHCSPGTARVLSWALMSLATC